MFYIQRRDFKNRTLETVDEFEDSKEAKKMRVEYGFSDPTAVYFISKRPCKAWKEDFFGFSKDSKENIHK